jgi:sulfatase modifying factor 1
MKFMFYSYKFLFCALLLLASNTLRAIEGFSLIPAGAFTMGDSLDGMSDAPTRIVTLDAFYMGKYEVTKAEWDEVSNWGLVNGYTDLSAGGAGKASNHPVNMVTWHQILKWCNARSEKEGLAPVYYTDDAQTSIYRAGKVDVTNAQVKWSANGYRLPTEAEWEKAARGGLSGNRFPWGNTISHSQANYRASANLTYDLSGGLNSFHPSYAVGPFPYTSPVGSFSGNAYGLYDMAGNVSEWCWDWYGTYTQSDNTNPRGALSGNARVLRGGSWDFNFPRVAKRYGNGPSNWTNESGFRVARSFTVTKGFSLIAAGAFTMGDSLDSYYGETPTRTVTLDAFYIGQYEVTKAEWDELRSWGLSNGYNDLSEGAGKAGNHPVHSISWHDMVKWCNARSQREGLMPVYYTDDAQTKIYKTGYWDVPNAHVKWVANGYRLPTEAEWEKAARGGLSGKRFPWGDTISHSQANYFASISYFDLSGSVNNFHTTYATGSEPYTSPVGAFSANGYGLYDMAGNVMERCWDLYGTYAAGSQTNPRGAASSAMRVIRGGSWDNGGSACRVAFRDCGYSSLSWDNVGFRVAFSPDLADNDGDGLSNYAEIMMHGSNPNLADSNGDGLRDGLIVALGKNPSEDVSGFFNAIMANRTELGLHTPEDITDMRVGSMMIERPAGANKLQFRMKLQKSSNLQNWQDDGEAVFELPVDSSATKRFYRFGVK